MSHPLLFRLVTLMCIAGGAFALLRGDTYTATSLTIAGAVAFAGALAERRAR